MQAGTPGRSLSPASPPGWTQGTPLLAVGLSAQCCVTPPGSCHLLPRVAGLHGSSIASKRWHHGLGGSALPRPAPLLVLFALSCALWVDGAKIKAECWGW